MNIEVRDISQPQQIEVYHETEFVSTQDLLDDIRAWLDYMDVQASDERLDLTEISEIERVHAITREKE